MKVKGGRGERGKGRGYRVIILEESENRPPGYIEYCEIQVETENMMGGERKGKIEVDILQRIFVRSTEKEER